MTKRLHTESGFALVVGLILLVLVSFVGMTAIKTSDTDVSIAGNQVKQTQAFYMAEAGAVNWMFDTKGYITIERVDQDPDEVFMIADFIVMTVIEENDNDGHDRANKGCHDPGATKKVFHRILPRFFISLYLR